jgi:hypothetical protein
MHPIAPINQHYTIVQERALRAYRSLLDYDTTTLNNPVKSTRAEHSQSYEMHHHFDQEHR